MRLVRPGDRRPDRLVGKTILWLTGEPLRILSIEHEYDDGTTCVYMDGPLAGTLTMRDTPRVRQLARDQGL